MGGELAEQNMFHSSCTLVENQNIDTMNDNLVQSIEESAFSIGMFKCQRKSCRTPSCEQALWYDDECREAKRVRNKCLSLCKKFNFQHSYLCNYNEA